MPKLNPMERRRRLEQLRRKDPVKARRFESSGFDQGVFDDDLVTLTATAYDNDYGSNYTQHQTSYDNDYGSNYTQHQTSYDNDSYKSPDVDNSSTFSND